ncbi:DUF3293 domain-containing protein [Lacimicrobium sp. SS2-24]|uniref:DUF3293 domain-containing protein n=1 Tax=Lacimicrobium sp. SS2-24 TaxID=2005569 RepID=UPI00143A779A|nr:DUF3293 domain-containing protein [Lacimicrobium sp. SS2-24]
MSQYSHTDKLEDLWQAYADTVFLVDSPLPDWPQAAIITACNPPGEIMTATENHRLHNQLVHHLAGRNLMFSEITGASPDHAHQERSLLIRCSKKQANALSEKVSQNAFFWIEQGTLYLCPCLLRQVTERRLGNFSARLIHR